MKKINRVVTIALFSVFIIGFLKCNSSWDNASKKYEVEEAGRKARETNPNEEDLKSTSKYMAKVYIKEKLYNPDEAKFDRTDNVTVREGRCTIIGYVASTNLHGGKIKVKYICTLLYTGGAVSNQNNWSLIDISVI